ncbi:Elongator complex protein 3 [Hondaea fermentalgiana]|uniref:tRNA carboxymethyluridine synthase n=1 Tax=Hondaea fermentalgiana TaxID=2315210 RepID=A0A2R5GUU8_9STRA|nr:Elongator complex protein 3 [Hondaea fermentalgiana]|eukprot:GBG32423.1 Elongator complex protein 3 [Hondaea fermentalgiana]
MASDAVPGRIAWQAGGAAQENVGECELWYENHDLEDIFRRTDGLVNADEWPTVESVLREVIAIVERVESGNGDANIDETLSRKDRHHLGLADESTLESFNTLFVPVLHNSRANLRKAKLLHAYRAMVTEGKLNRCEVVERVLITKKSKSDSGVLVITVLTSPYPDVDGEKQRFSCAYNCYYCPNQPGQPRSYLRDEPAVLRANQNGFDPVLQFTDRAHILMQNGHPCDKVELLVLGGTWSSYPLQYQEAFCRDLFYAANTLSCRPEHRRPRRSLADEQRENEDALCKIIGLTLETRPDCVDNDELRRLRRYGCTRVQIGLQSTDDAILAKINRGCTCADAKRSIRLLKDAAFKIDVHLMPSLPGATPESDKVMFQEMLYNPDLQADQWKIYPCEVTPWTVISKWHERGEYAPYSDEDLAEVVIDLKSQIHPWIRLNRIVRDIPSTYILGGVCQTNWRQGLVNQMEARGLKCRCMRCREVRLQQGRFKDAVLRQRSYRGSDGTEHFLSFETPDEDTLFGFVRLRVPDQNPPPETAFPELNGGGVALVRELHVYGKLVPTRASKTEKVAKSSVAQHTGFGARLMAECERLALGARMTRIAVIAGVGTRSYYRRLGYRLEGEGSYLIKTITG